VPNSCLSRRRGRPGTCKIRPEFARHTSRLRVLGGHRTHVVTIHTGAGLSAPESRKALLTTAGAPTRWATCRLPLPSHGEGHQETALRRDHRRPPRLMSLVLRPVALATASWRSSADTNLVHPAACAAATWSRSRLRARYLAAYRVESSLASVNT